MRVTLLKLCEYALMGANGRLSVIGMFDNIRSDRFPFEHPPFFVVVELELEAHEKHGELALELVFIDEDGRALLNLPSPPHRLPENETPGPMRLKTMTAIGSVRFETPGSYRLDLIVKGEKLGEERVPVFRVGS